MYSEWERLFRYSGRFYFAGYFVRSGREKRWSYNDFIKKKFRKFAIYTVQFYCLKTDLLGQIIEHTRETAIVLLFSAVKNAFWVHNFGERCFGYTTMFVHDFIFFFLSTNRLVYRWYFTDHPVVDFSRSYFKMTFKLKLPEIKRQYSRKTISGIDVASLLVIEFKDNRQDPKFSMNIFGNKY